MTISNEVMTIENAAQICGFKLQDFKTRLELPADHPKAFKHLRLIDNKYLYAADVEEFAKRSRERQGQSQILPDDIIRDKLAEIVSGYEGLKRAAMLAISYFAGLRVGEIANLQIQHVIDNEGDLRETAILYRDETKTRQGRRIFLAHPLVRFYLSEFLRIRLIKNPPRKQRLFLTIRENKPYTRTYLSTYFKRIYKSVKIDDCSSHSGRAATVTRHLRKGKGLKYAARFVGHTSTNTTAIYDRVSDSDILDDLRNDRE